MMNSAFLELKQLSIGYHEPLTQPLEFSVMPGNLISVVGANGAGKTTLIRTILGLIPPLSGVVIQEPSLRIGYVPQRRALNLNFPLTLHDLVLQGLVHEIGMLRRTTTEHLQRVHNSLAQVGLWELRSRTLETLSGGQLQRGLVARALVTEPQVLILDEATSGMDMVHEEQFLNLVHELALARSVNMATLMITHDLQRAARISSHVLMINGQTKQALFGATRDLLNSTCLSSIFGVPITVSWQNDEIAIHVTGTS